MPRLRLWLLSAAFFAMGVLLWAPRRSLYVIRQTTPGAYPSRLINARAFGWALVQLPFLILATVLGLVCGFYVLTWLAAAFGDRPL
jgi:hypothetical protein